MTRDPRREVARRRLLVGGAVLAPLALAHGLPRHASVPRAELPTVAMHLEVGDVLKLQASLPMPAWY